MPWRKKREYASLSGVAVDEGYGAFSEVRGLDIDRVFDMIERKDITIYNDLGQTSGIAQAVHTDLQQGPARDTISGRRKLYGENKLPEREQVSFFSLVLGAVNDPMLIVLIVAAILEIIFGMALKNPYTGQYDHETGWITGTAILISVAIVVLLTAVNDYSKAKKFEELYKQTQDKEVDVLREGQKVAVDISELVVGDVMFVQNGQQLEVDCVFIEGQDLITDESVATGETDLQKKNSDKDPFFMSGTNITEGMGKGLVVGVGENSFAGRLAMATRVEEKLTPLQEKLARLADLIGYGGMAVAVLIVICLSITEIWRITQGKSKANPVTFLNYVVVAIAIVVVAIPEGLPLAVTIALAYSMQAMLKDNCLVRVLASCETMGAATAICSDKTGTLTKNEMTVVQGWVAGQDFVITGYGVNGPKGATEMSSTAAQFRLDKVTSETLQLVFKAISFNSTSEEILADDGRIVWKGNKTENGMLAWVKRFGADYQNIRDQVPDSEKRMFPFSSSKKRMTTLVKESEQVFVYVKGASEMVVADCDSMLTQDGTCVPLPKAQSVVILDNIQAMASQGNRTIAIAYKILPEVEEWPPVEEPNCFLTLICIVGIQDPIREEVPEAVKLCHSAGIKIRMVTGDNINTAVAIAKKCGIHRDGDVAMQGRDFRALAATDPVALREKLRHLTVLARSSPTDKHLMVGELMEMGEVVAVTGDGTNDAPALSLADVGFAMRSGTDVAQNASKMVMMDDNFATVVKATKWGRTVNDNVRKFLQFQLTVNVAGVLMTFLGSIINERGESPLQAVQLLWLNLIMDTLAALALATERPSDDCLKRPPTYRGGPLITWRMWSFVLIHGFYQLAWVMTLIQVGHIFFGAHACVQEDWDKNIFVRENYCRGGVIHMTCVFNTFVLFQVFNQFNARKLYGEWNVLEGILVRSRAFLGVFLIIAAFQFVAVQFFGPFMHTHGLTAAQWGLCLAVASTEVLLGILVRLLPIGEWKPKTPMVVLSAAKAEEIAQLTKSIVSQSKCESNASLSAHDMGDSALNASQRSDSAEVDLLDRFRRASRRAVNEKYHITVEGPDGDRRNSLRYSLPGRGAIQPTTVVEERRSVSLRKLRTGKGDEAHKRYSFNKASQSLHGTFGA